MRQIVLLARPNRVDGRREFLSIRLEDFRALYLTEGFNTSNSRTIRNAKRGWACSPRDMVDEFTG